MSLHSLSFNLSDHVNLFFITVTIQLFQKDFKSNYKLQV